MQRRIKPTARTIGCGTFEGQIPPQVWIKFLKKNRAIFCPSVYNTEQFKSQLDQVFLIPHTLDLQFYNAEVKASQNYSKFSFLFLNSWRKRKGIDLLLSAWQKAFKTNKNVQLVIKTDEPLRAEKQIRLYQDAAPIIVDKNKYKYSELPGYIKSFDCVINPTYGEGFGLTGLQALALGVSLITTNHSGCTDYAKNNNSFLLHPKGFEKVPCLDNISQFRNQEWPILDVEELVYLMRAVYLDKILREARISNGLITAGKFSHGLAVQKFNEMIKSLY
jgi:glycosyltransferase involved in cell wall biosynthesis